MLYIKCKTLEEFNEIMERLRSFAILEKDLLREEPFFVRILQKELKIEFLMTSKELLNCSNKEEELYKFGIEESHAEYWNREVNRFFKSFYPAFRGLMLVNFSFPDSVIDIEPSEEDLKKPEIIEGLRLRETFKKACSNENNDSNIDIIKDSVYIDNFNNSLHINKFRSYSSACDQNKWCDFSQKTIQEVSELFKKREKISLFELLKRLGDKRLEIAIELKHNFNYKEINGLQFASPPLTHYFGALRGRDVFSESIYERISEDNLQLPLHLVKQELLEKLESGIFTKSYIDTGYREYLKFNYIDKFVNEEDDHANFRIEVETSLDKTESVVEVLYPEIKDSEQLEKVIEKLNPYFNVLLNWKKPTNAEEAKEFLKALGKLTYHVSRMLPFRLGTSAIMEWIIRGMADAMGISLGKTIPNTCEKKNDWKEPPFDWKAFLCCNEDEYAKWFVSGAFSEIKLNNEIIFDYFQDSKTSTTPIFSNNPITFSFNDSNSIDLSDDEESEFLKSLIHQMT